MISNMIDTGSGGGVTAAHGLAYRVTPFNITILNTWFDIPLDGGNSEMVNTSHSTSVQPARLQVDTDGVYMITGRAHIKRQTAPRHMVARVYVNSTTEVPASFCEVAPIQSDANFVLQLVSTSIYSLSAGDYMALQVSTNSLVTNEIDMYDDVNLADPTTRNYASLAAVRIG